MRPKLKVANVDGKKMLVVNGRTLLSRKQVTEQIAVLDDRATKRLPAARAALSAQELLASAQDTIDRQITEAAEAKQALEAALAQLD